MNPSPNTLLAIPVSIELPSDESVELASVNAGSTEVVFVACVEPIDRASSSWITCTAEVDLVLVLLEYMKTVAMGAQRDCSCSLLVFRLDLRFADEPRVLAYNCDAGRS